MQARAGGEIDLHKTELPLSDMAQLIDLPRITDGRGNLSFVEGGRHIPFDIARVYYLYDVPDKQVRAGHAHRKLRQLLIAVSGSFDLHLDNGNEKAVFHMARPDQGLIMGSLIWREIHNFSTDAVCLVLASMPYEEQDYIRSYDKFLAVCASRL